VSAEDDFFDEAEPRSPMGPIFTAQYECDDSCCGEGIVPGEGIRADGHGGWIHADDQCERMALAPPRQTPPSCPSCFLVHAGECL
jgi:hypothetical protein